MTRKDYVRFAAMFKSVHVYYLSQDKPDGEKAVEWIANKSADIFQADNPAFDRAKFLKACGVDS